MIRLNRSALLLLAVAVVGCAPTAPTTVPSPTGVWSVTASINESKSDPRKYLCVVLDVEDVTTGDHIHRVQTSASDTMKWAIGWYGDDTIVLHSSDIGTSAWIVSDDRTVSELESPLPAEILSRGQQLKDQKHGR